MINIEEIVLMTDEELKNLTSEVNKIIESRQEKKKIRLETCNYFDPRKHGHAYIARVTLVDDKIQREFLEDNGKAWDSKHKTYSTSFSFRVGEGDMFEARLNHGSWKNDYKEWYKCVKNDEGKLILRPFISLTDMIEE